MSEVFNLEEYLTGKGIEIRGTHADEINVLCWFHGEEPSKRGRLYINVGSEETLGLYNCFKCDARGNLTTLMRSLGDEPPQRLDGLDQSRINELYQLAADFYHDNLQIEHWKYLTKERLFTGESIKQHKFGWANGGLYKFLRDAHFSYREIKATGLVIFPEHKSHELTDENKWVLEQAPYDTLRDMLTIPYWVAGNVVQIRGNKLNGLPKYKTPPNQPARLYNTDVTWNTERIFVTEGEKGAALLTQLGYPAVGVPGANIWQESWSKYIEGKTIYIAYDNDKAGIDGAAKLKERFPEARQVEYPTEPDDDGIPTITDETDYFQKHPVEDFEELIREESKGILISVYEAFEEWESIQGGNGLQTGFERLDHLVAPGFFPGQIIIPIAKTNAGKSILLLNLFQRIMMVPGQEDYKVLYISLEQTRGEWAERARRIYNFYNMNIGPGEINEETKSFWNKRLFLTDKGRVTKEQLQQAVEDFKLQVGQYPNVIAIDYLGYWANSFRGGSRYEQMTNAIMALKEVSKDIKIPIFTPTQVNRGNDMGTEITLADIRDSGAVEETADFAFSLWNPDTKTGIEPDQRQGVVHSRLLKSRHGGKGQKFSFQFAYSTLAMVPLEDPLHILAKDEIEYSARHMPWEEVIWRHKTGQKTGQPYV